MHYCCPSAAMKIKTQDVLKVLGATTLVVSATALPNLSFALITTYKFWQKINQRDLGKVVKRLVTQKMLRISENGNQILIEITQKGKRRLLEYDIENIKLKAKKRDNKWRLIMFDIPEKLKQNRDNFRKKLLQLGMIRLQDSIFVSAFPCKDEIDFLCHAYQISDFVSLLSIDKIERGDQLIFKSYRNWDNLQL